MSTSLRLMPKALVLLTTRWCTMNTWICEEYGRPLVYRQTSMPGIQKQNDIVVKVEAASVNPIDVRMCEGYGKEAMTAMHMFEERGFDLTSMDYHRLPLITGRDFCGEVAQIGAGVQDIKIGDRIIGVVPAWWNGAHGEYVRTNTGCVAPKPRSVDALHATALVYTLTTVWSALKVGQVPTRNAQNCRILIHGGSGGIGTTAIQLLREWKAQKIVATCSERNLQYVRDLGAVPVDYSAPDIKDQLTREGPFDLILDCATSPLTEWSVSPLLSNMDRHGFLMGLLTSAGQLLYRNLENFRNGRLFLYAFFWPDREAVQHLSTLIDEGRINPVIEKVYPLTELPEAYSKVGQMHARGKTVIDFGSRS